MTSKIFPGACRTNLRSLGFTLVEVALSLAISAFAFVGVVGLLPAGLKTSRRAVDNSLTAYIAQQVIGEMSQTDFSELTKDATSSADGYTFCKSVRYFDAAGNEVALTGSSAPLYYVNTRVLPAAPVSSGTGSGFNSQMAVVTVQVATNPSGVSMSMEEGGASDVTQPLRNLWKASPSTPIATYSVVVANAQ